MSKIRESRMCPVCKTWFYPDSWRRKYDKPECRKIGQSINAAKQRQETKRRSSP